MVTITQNDVLAACRAYSDCLEKQSAVCGSSAAMNGIRERIAMDQARIWERAISPAIRGGWDTSILAANNSDPNLQTLAGTLVVQRALELLPINYPILTAVTSDFSAERLALNQEMTTRIITIPAVKTYSAENGWDDGTPAATDVHLTIDKHVGVPLTFNANQISGTLRNLFDEMTSAASAALAKDMVTSLYALLTAENFPNATVCDLANFGRGAVVDISTEMTLRGVPIEEGNRTLLLAPAFFGALAKDPAVLTLATRGQPEAGERSSLANVADFRVSNSPTLPSTENLCGFAFSRSALVIATRLAGDYMKALPVEATYGNRYVISEPQLGISVQVVDYVNHLLGTATRRLSLMYGVALGNGLAGQRLVSK